MGHHEDFNGCTLQQTRCHRKTRVSKGQVFFSSKAGGQRTISGILAGQPCHTNVNSPGAARHWWAVDCAWLSGCAEGRFQQALRVCTAPASLATPLCVSRMGSDDSSGRTAQKPVFIPFFSPNFLNFCFCEQGGPTKWERNPGTDYTQSNWSRRSFSSPLATSSGSMQDSLILTEFQHSVWQRATVLSEGRHGCYTSTANTDTAAHPVPPTATGAQED